MKRLNLLFFLACALAGKADAQPSLEFFTNQANISLESQFGFSVTNIPVYSATNSTVAYSASLHYLLQAAANAYDSTTPSSNLPSVFRPLFSWEGSNLFIVSYATVTTNFLAQIGRGFKTLTDPTICSNDNVWGIPWVIGAKNNTPAFNGYSCSSEVILTRDLVFVRGTASNGSPEATRPPLYTNQFLIMAVSNLFGVGAWNYASTAYTNSVTLMVSNEVSISLTNDYDGGTNFVLDAGTNYAVDSWPGGMSASSFLTPLLTNLTLLDDAYWSDFPEQFNDLEVLQGEDSYTGGFLPPDLRQTGWPVHNWTLNITNNLMYALIDNASGQVLDFVNLGNFGSSLKIVQSLTNASSGFPEAQNMWAVGNATDAPNSRISEGALNQIVYGMEQNEVFADSIVGIPVINSNAFFFGDPDSPAAIIVQNYTRQAADPLVHYTLADLSPPTNGPILPGNDVSVDLFLNIVELIPPSLPNWSGQLSPYYNSGAVKKGSIYLTNGAFNLAFCGATDLPYQIWASTNIMDWSQIGTASQPLPGSFQFSGPAITNYPARFYQVRFP